MAHKQDRRFGDFISPFYLSNGREANRILQSSESADLYPMPGVKYGELVVVA
jgi:hypothetical protein